ncbi:MAG TPA: trypsin-like serine protease [Bauldia sp.]
MRLANLKTTLARLGRAWPIAACIAFALLIQTPASADQPPLGLKFGVQPWTPVTDDDAVHFLVDSPTFLSDGMNLAWNLFSDELRQKIVDKLLTPDMLMKGVTLYDVDVRLNQPTFSFANLKGGSQPGEPFYADLSVTLNDEGVTLTSTTPDFIPDIDLTKITSLLLTPFGRTFSEVKIVPDAHGIGSFGDPRCSADFDATVHLKVKFENIPGAALSSDQLDASSPPVIDFTRFHFDSNNAVCDIPVGLASLLDLKPFIEALVTNPPANGGLVEGPLNDAVRKAIAGFIKDANATLAPLQNKYPEINLLLAQAWIVPEPGGQQIVLDLSPSPRLPDPTAGLGRLSGTITAATPVGLQSQAGTVHCEQLPVTVARKWGPRKMVGPSGTLGDEDYEALSVKPGCSEGQLEPGQTGHYTITGLSALFPQTIIFGTAGAGCNGPEAGVKQGIDVRAAGWTEGKMRPQDLYLQGIDLNNIVSAVKTQQPASLFSQHDIAARHWLLTCGNVQHPFDLSKFLWQINPGDIASNPTTNVANPTVNTAAPLVLASPLSSAAAALAAAQGGAPAISGKLAGNLANVKNLAAQNLAINPAGVAPIVPQTQRVMTQNLPLPANCKDTSEGRVCSQSQAIISGVPVTPADQQARGLVTVGGGCSGTLINQYWVLTAHHCIAVGGRLPPGALQPPGNIAITATWSGKTPVATKFVDYGVGANPIDMALIFLGNGDFGPAPIQPLAVGDIDNGDTLEKFGQGYSTYAIAGPPPIPAQGLGTYTTGTFTSSGVTHYGYVLANPSDPATLSAPQSGEGGDSGGPDWLVGPGGVLGGIVGVQSTCQPTGQVTPLPNNWLWVTGISGCYSPSIASVRDNIISASQEKPQLRQALKKGVDKFTVRAADIYLTA